MAQRFPTGGPSPVPPPGAMQPQQRYPGPAQPQGSPMPPRPYPGPNFPGRVRRGRKAAVQAQEAAGGQDPASEGARPGAGVAGLHGPAGLRAQAGRHYHAQAPRHPGGAQALHEAEAQAQDIHLQYILPGFHS